RTRNRGRLCGTDHCSTAHGIAVAQYRSRRLPVLCTQARLGAGVATAIAPTNPRATNALVTSMGSLLFLFCVSNNKRRSAFSCSVSVTTNGGLPLFRWNIGEGGRKGRGNLLFSLRQLQKTLSVPSATTAVSSLVVLRGALDANLPPGPTEH